MSFPRNIWKNIGIDIRENVSSKYSQKLLDHAKQSSTDALKTASRRLIQKAAEATGDLTENKITDKIAKVSRSSTQTSSETVETKTENSKFDKEISIERYISP